MAIQNSPEGETEWKWNLWSDVGLGLLFGEVDRDIDLEREPASASLKKSHLWTLQFHTLAKKDEPALEVVFNLGELEPGIHP